MERMVFEAIKNQQKMAMPWVSLRDGRSVDLFFEYLEPKQKKEFFSDLQRGHEIELSDLAKLKKKFHDNVSRFSEDDLKDIVEENKIKSFLDSQTKNPLLDYDNIKHRFTVK